MSQSPCWSDAEIGRIVKPDAEEISDHVFHAVHCPTELQIASTHDGVRMPEAAESLIARFLDPRQDYVQAVVVGESGTGKSHLIQWLRLNIPADDRTVMLTIPKTGISLRGIIERIIFLLPEEARGEYSERLDRSGTYAMSKVAKVDKIIDSLAWAVEHGGLAVDPTDVDLSIELPNILRDPHFRSQVFRISGGAIDQIVDHVFSDPDKRDSDFDRREFRLGDLPLSGTHYSNASSNARGAIDYIMDEPGMDARAIAMMNRNLNLAIAHTLHFSADHLIELMNSIRRHLAQQGKRLILLIEDFARTQGIDTALLQALITPPSQGDEQLCELRWAMAITTGPFNTSILQTARTRTTFLVDMDVSAPASLAQFTAGYLNALRFGESQLQAIPRHGKLPSRCSLCDKKPGCFEAFGHVDGIGLFPFTERAITVMADRTESRVEAQFNPRKFLRSVVQTVVSTHYEELEHGEFPSLSLLKQIGGGDIVRPLDRQRIAQSDGADADRRITLLELWGDGTGHISNLSPGIHQAFGIPLLADAPDALSTEQVSGNIEQGAANEKTSQADRASEDVEAIRIWTNGRSLLSSNLANKLRNLIFPILDGAIDWDATGFRKSLVSSPKSGPFRTLSINFQNQQTQFGRTVVVLEIGPKHALALEAILKHESHGGWDFKDGIYLFANMLEAIREWKIDVEGQVKRLFSGKPGWDPLIAVVELLTLSLYANGGLKVSDTPIDMIHSRIWEERQVVVQKVSHKPFNDVLGLLAKNNSKWVELLRGLGSGTKGGRAGNFVRATQVLEGIRSIRQRSLELSQTPPDVADGSPIIESLKELADVYRRVQVEFLSSLIMEKQNCLTWFAHLESNLGTGTTISLLKEELTTVLLSATKFGINAGASRRVLEETLENIKPRVLDAAIAHSRALRDANAAESVIRIIAINESRQDLDRLSASASDFLERAGGALVGQREGFEHASVAGLKESDRIIEFSLESLDQSLSDLESICEGKL